MLPKFSFLDPKLSHLSSKIGGSDLKLCALLSLSCHYVRYGEIKAIWYPHGVIGHTLSPLIGGPLLMSMSPGENTKIIFVLQLRFYPCFLGGQPFSVYHYIIPFKIEQGDIPFT